MPSPGDGDPSVVEPLRITKRDSSSPKIASTQYNTPLPYPDDSSRPVAEGARLGSPSHAHVSSSPAGSAPLDPSDIPPSLRPREGRETKAASLGERRGNIPKPLPDSPAIGSERDPRMQATGQMPALAPSFDPATQNLSVPEGGINRISSTTSVSTTRAQRGSPPPPETPIVGPGEQPGPDIEARYAAAGIAGTSTLAGLQAQSAAAQSRAGQYVGQQPWNQQPTQQRPWTPTELPGSQPHGAPTVYQGPGVAAPQNQMPNAHPAPSAPSQQPPGVTPNAIDQDFERMQITSDPPPAYSSVSSLPASQQLSNEKPRPTAPAAQTGTPANHPATRMSADEALSAAAPAAVTQDHPALASDPRMQQPGQSLQSVNQNGQTNIQQTQVSGSPAPPGMPPSSPPPLPEGWIAHLDPNSGQYYYIHLPTQSTQWEFPKGPTPLNLNEAPLSPTGSVYSSRPLQSPGLSAFGKPMASPGLPMTPGYESLHSPATGFTGPPPSSGVDLYKTAPTNGVYFGPYLRYTNMDLERGIWLGSILLATDGMQPPTIHIHQSVDLSPNPRQLKAVGIAAHQRWTFYRYDIDLRMEETVSAKWTYAITSHLGCTRYEFLVAGRQETNWRFVATSGNDFSINVNANERARLGGEGYMWKDIMQKHNEIGGFHAQLCLGGQIYADRMWKDIPSLKQWLSISGKEARKNAPWTAAQEEDVSHAYFHYYTSHFDQPNLREAFAQIPYICQIDDHDIFDGFGSYPEHMQFSNVFKNVGRIGIEMYLLFQHHTTLEILRNVKTDVDLFTVTGTGWHFVKYLGPAVVVVGPDCRSERNQHQVMAGPTYQGIFPKVAMLPPSVQHCLWMISVPVVYPRLESAEQIAQTVATGKKAVTGAYNVLGKVTSSVAGVVGAKDVVGSGFDSVKRAVGKSGLMGGILSPFGEFDLFDELRDQWTHESKDLERTYLIRTLQGIAHQKSLRMTFLSGAVNVCGAGLVHDPAHPSDYKTMYQLISSPVINSPTPSYIMKVLHGNNKPLYVPANGHRSTPSQPTDTKEDMMEIFQTGVNGHQLEHRKLMGRRNYVAIVAYDPDAASTTYAQPDLIRGRKLSLAADFMVQGDGTFGNVVKYGPVIVPSLGQ